MRLSLPGCSVHVVDQGEGQPILFLHGNPDSSRMWDRIATSLAASHRCIIPDLPGFGHSSAADHFDYSLDGLAKFVDALYDQLGLQQKVHLVGHDFGGICAAAWMTRRPERVLSFTASNTVFSSDYRWHYWARIWRTPLIGEFSAFAMNRLIFQMELRRGSRALTREHIESTYALITPAVKASILKLYRAVTRQSFVGWESRYMQAAADIPVLVLWGEDDPYMPAQFADALGARRVVRIAGAGHWLPVVEPARFADELRQFIDPAA